MVRGAQELTLSGGKGRKQHLAEGTQQHIRRGYEGSKVHESKDMKRGQRFPKCLKDSCFCEGVLVPFYFPQFPKLLAPFSPSRSTVRTQVQEAPWQRLLKCPVRLPAQGQPAAPHFQAPPHFRTGVTKHCPPTWAIAESSMLRTWTWTPSTGAAAESQAYCCMLRMVLELRAFLFFPYLILLSF